MKGLTLTLGGLTTLVGIIWLVNPLSTVSFLAWVLAFALFAAAVSQMSFYFSLEPQYRNIWSLLQSILSLIFALIIFGMSGAERANFLITLVGFWAIAIGITRILLGFSLRDTAFDRDRHILSSGVWTLVIGILLLVLPLLFSAFIGYLAAFFLIIAGVSLLITGLQLP
ncbi:DUF308 domain-containing protein [Streptococcus sp. DD12]|uniref:DUF308 domain-containing protein n=1 Tax=Streptococcus sp. DD12 TaxID=1777880 RepID=UPI00079C3B45|nr:DUF308 domain-containing protein [Streptococcus sp. DD12]KXT76609.1 putative membrane protein [Streptococcus sp. DD12]